MAGKFELKMTKSGKYHFNLLTENGLILLSSEMYETKQAAENAILAVKLHVNRPGGTEVLESSSGKYYFVIRGMNTGIVAQSPLFESYSSLDDAISILSAFIRDAKVEENLGEKLDGVVNVDCLSTFLSELEKISLDDDHLYFFRGHSDVRYELVPSVYRDLGWIENEDVIYKELILRCPSEFDSIQSTFQALVKMQHFSLPTRLLDLTSNPLVALYFATDDQSKKKQEGEVIVFKIPKKHIKYYDSDTVSVLSNLSRRPSSFNVPDANLTLEKFNEEPQIKYLLHEIKQEKPYFQPLIKREHLESVVCVKPKLDNARILKQDGVFLLFGISGGKSKPALIPNEYILSSENPLIINGEKKELIRSQLKSLGITRGSIYPDIENVANFIKSEFSILR